MARQMSYPGMVSDDEWPVGRFRYSSQVTVSKAQVLCVSKDCINIGGGSVEKYIKDECKKL